MKLAILKYGVKLQIIPVNWK